MTIEFSCGGCQYPFRVSDSLAGKKGKCPKCGEISPIPMASVGSPISAVPPPPRPVVRAKDPDDRDRDRDYDDRRRDDYDDEPAPRRKRNKKSKTGLIIGLTVGGVVLLAGIGLGLYFLLGPSGLSAEDMKFLPADAQIILSMKVDEMLNSSAWREVKKEMGEGDPFKDSEREFGLAVDKIDRITMGASIKEGPDKGIVIVKTKKDVKIADITSTMKGAKFKETKVGKYTMQENESEWGHSVCAVDSKTIVLGPTKMLKTVLERDKKPEFSATMQAAMSKADFSKTVAFAINVKDAIPPGALDKGGMPPGINLDLEAIKSIEGVAGHAKFSSDVSSSITAICKDSKGAEGVKKLLEAGITLVKTFAGGEKDVADLLNAIKVGQSGSTVTASVTVRPSSFTKAGGGFFKR